MKPSLWSGPQWGPERDTNESRQRGQRESDLPPHTVPKQVLYIASKHIWHVFCLCSNSSNQWQTGNITSILGPPVCRPIQYLTRCFQLQLTQWNLPHYNLFKLPPMTEKKWLQPNDTKPSFNLWDVSTTCPSFYKRVIQPVSVSIVTIEQTKRGPSLSVCMLRGPWLTSLTHKRHKEKRKQVARGRRKGGKRVHTLFHPLPSSPSVLEKTKRGRTEREKEGGRRQERRRKEGGMWGERGGRTVHSLRAN